MAELIFNDLINVYTVTPLANAHGRLGRKLGGTGGWAAVRGPP